MTHVNENPLFELHVCTTLGVSDDTVVGSHDLWRPLLLGVLTNSGSLLLLSRLHPSVITRRGADVVGQQVNSLLAPSHVSLSRSLHFLPHSLKVLDKSSVGSDIPKR